MDCQDCQDCKHETIVFKKCIICGQEMMVIHPAVSTVNAQLNLSKYHIPDNVRRRAMNIYASINVDAKKGKRKELEFFLIYSAYKEENEVVEPHALARDIGISVRSISRIYAMFSPALTGYKPPVIIGDAIQLIPQLIANLGACDVEMVEDIILIAKRVVLCDPTLLEQSPQKLAVAIILSYFEKHEYTLDKQYLCDLVNVTNGTLNVVVKSIKNIL